MQTTRFSTSYMSELISQQQVYNCFIQVSLKRPSNVSRCDQLSRTRVSTSWRQRDAELHYGLWVTMPLLVPLSTGWFEEMIWAWFYNQTKIKWVPYGQLVSVSTKSFVKNKNKTSSNATYLPNHASSISDCQGTIGCGILANRFTCLLITTGTNIQR